MDNKIVKFVFFIVLALLAFPFLMKLMPKPYTFDRALAAFEATGCSVAEFEVKEKPDNEAIAQVTMQVDTAFVQIFQYNAEGKISKHLGYQKQDSGALIAEGMNIAQSIGAPVKEKPKFGAARKGMFLIVVRDYDRAEVNRLLGIFNGM